jgi:PEP-CTERM motif
MHPRLFDGLRAALSATAIASLTAAAALTAPAVRAAVVESADVGGFRTFTDTTTGRIWADLNNLYSPSNTALHGSYAGYLGSLQQAGFTYATTLEVAALFATLPLSAPGSFAAYEAVMASGHGTGSASSYLGGFALEAGQNRDAGAFDGDTFWSYAGAPDPFPSITLGGPASIGIWAYIDAVVLPPGGQVPEPGSLALLGAAALAGCAVRRRHRA